MSHEVQPLVLRKPLKRGKLVMKNRTKSFIQCGDIGKRTKKSSDSLP